MNFTKTTSYSIKVMSYMAKHENIRMSATYLHRNLSIPYSYLRSILGELSKKNLITGTKGRKGGFTLKREKSRIYLAEIIEITEGLDNFNKCIMGFDQCPFDLNCLLHPAWIKMRTEILNILGKTSLSDMLIKDNLT